MTASSAQKSPIIVAIDKHNLDEVLMLADSLDPTLCRLKVGKELFTTCGPNVVKSLQNRGFEIFLDLKFHDIPNTTAQAVLRIWGFGWLMYTQVLAVMQWLFAKIVYYQKVIIHS